MDLINIPNNKCRCRLCGENSENTFDMFSQQGVRSQVVLILTKHFGFLHIHNNGTDAPICKSCWTIVQDFNKLYEKVELQWSSFTKDFNSETNIDIKIEIDHNTSPILEDNCVKLETPFKEEIGLFDHGENRNRDNAVDSDPLNEINFHEDDSGLSQDSSSLVPTETTHKNQKEYPQKHEDEKKILEYFGLDCKDCSYSSKTYLNFLQHSRLVHNKRAYIYCCDRKFVRRCRVLEHITWHTNPESFKCHKCNKLYASKFILKNHMETHIPISERQHKCNQCPLSYSTSQLLSSHLRSSHKARTQNFGCDICQKTFSTKYTTKKHIINTHVGKTSSHICYICAKTYKNESSLQLHLTKHITLKTKKINSDGGAQSSHICHICAKMFKNKSSLKFHLRENHNKDPERPKVNCHICGACFNNELYLKRHTKRHFETEVKCSLCDKVAPTKLALQAHMRYMHVERSHKCSICGKCFARPLGLKEHMASHTGQDLYNCLYCTRTFKSNANMHTHRKKAHPMEWNADRKKRINRT